jgi:sulfide:quinone oxidoreductase
MAISHSRTSNFANIAHDIAEGARSAGYAANSEPIASAMSYRDTTRHNPTGYGQVMKTRIAVLGAGFGGLELSTLLSESMGAQVDVTLIDKSDSFVFGYSKLDVMFGRTTFDAVRLPYRNFVKPGVRFLQQTVTSIDPLERRVTTSAGTYDADYLVVALGADYDLTATPGLVEGGEEFYSVAGRSQPM